MSEEFSISFNAYQNHAFMDWTTARNGQVVDAVLDGMKLNPESLQHLERSKLIKLQLTETSEIAAAWSDTDILGSDLSSIKLNRAKLTNVFFANGHLRESIITNSALTNCRFQASDLRNSEFSLTSFNNVEFKDNDLSYTKWSHCSFYDCPEVLAQSLLHNAEFIGCFFYNIDFSTQEMLKLAKFEACHFISCQLTNAQTNFLANSNLFSENVSSIVEDLIRPVTTTERTAPKKATVEKVEEKIQLSTSAKKEAVRRATRFGGLEILSKGNAND